MTDVEVYADHETGTVVVQFPGGTFPDPASGQPVTVEPHEVTLNPANARLLAYNLTLASYSLEGDNLS